MKRIDFNQNWLFTPSRIGVSDLVKQNETKTVNLPHDFSIIQKMDHTSAAGPNTGFYQGGTATYEKKFEYVEDWSRKTVIAEFEGVYMNSTVWINDQIIAKQPYGYTSFLCDLTPYLFNHQENILKVSVNNECQPNSRWYSGSGIYRPVWLHIGQDVHLKPWNLFVSTPEVTLQNAKVRIQAECILPEGYTLKNTILNSLGKVVNQKESDLLDQIINVEAPELWSPDYPYLYQLVTEILLHNEVIDSSTTLFGIRSISVDFVGGFKLNGIPMKLKGGCVHHDCGLLGSAAYARAEERKIELLKSSGFNAVRCAHNPPSPAFLNACDKLGMLVIDEAFDCWREGKTPYDYNLYFDAKWKDDMESMVFRDRNHPSVIMWSSGNEIVERAGRSDGYATSKMLADYLRKLDPTRLATNALCPIWGVHLPAIEYKEKKLLQWADAPDTNDVWGDLTYKFAEPLDVSGYNYLIERYVDDATKYPGRILMGSETYPFQAFEYWESTMQNDHVIGDFVWTAIDYLGEAGIGHIWYENEGTFMGNFPWNQAFCGDIDICGFKRPQSYYRDCLWIAPETPYIAVFKPEYYGKTPDISPWGWYDVINCWSWPEFEGKPIQIQVYSIADEVELLLNGNSLGKKHAGKENKYIATFDTNYAPGTLKAISYKNGEILGTSEIISPAAQRSIKLTPDRSSIKSEYGDLSYVTVELVDDQGNLVSHSMDNVTFEISGPGALLAVGSSNPKTEEGYVGNQRCLYYGKAMVVVKSEGTQGEIILSAQTESGIKGQCELTVV